MSAFNCPFGPHDVVTVNHRYLGGYILKVGKHYTFAPNDIQAALHFYASLSSPPKSLSILIAQDSRANLSDSCPPALRLHPVNIRCAAALPLVAGEGDVDCQRAALCTLLCAPSNGATPRTMQGFQLVGGMIIQSLIQGCMTLNSWTVLQMWLLS